MTRVTAEAVELFREAIALASVEPQCAGCARCLHLLAMLLQRNLGLPPDAPSVMVITMDSQRPVEASPDDWERAMAARRSLVAAT